MIIRRILRGLSARLMLHVSRTRLNWWRTAFVNFYFLPFHQAKKFPIYVYGKLKFSRFNGNIEIDMPLNEIEKGMIKLNLRDDSATPQGEPLEITITQGKIIFKGRTDIYSGGRWLIYGDGVLTIGKNVTITPMTTIGCAHKISIGDGCVFGPQCQLFDTDFHFTFGADMKVRPDFSSVVLGPYCWLGSRVSILKDVILPPHTTVGSNSLVNSAINRGGGKRIQSYRRNACTCYQASVL